MAISAAKHEMPSAPGVNTAFTTTSPDSHMSRQNGKTFQFPPQESVETSTTDTLGSFDLLYPSESETSTLNKMWSLYSRYDDVAALSLALNLLNSDKNISLSAYHSISSLITSLCEEQIQDPATQYLCISVQQQIDADFAQDMTGFSEAIEYMSSQGLDSKSGTFTSTLNDILASVDQEDNQVYGIVNIQASKNTGDVGKIMAEESWETVRTSLINGGQNKLVEKLMPPSAFAA